MQDKTIEELKRLFYQVALSNEQRRARLEDLKAEEGLSDANTSRG